MSSLPDPRRFPLRPNAAPEAQRLYALAEASLGASTRDEADRSDDAIGREIGAMLRADGDGLSRLLDGAPSVAVYRHLWRSLARQSAASRAGDVVMTLFAIPVCIVAATTAGAGARAIVSGVLAEVQPLVMLLQAHGALGGNRAFGLANTLVDSRAIDVPELARMLAANRLDARGAQRPRSLAPAPIEVVAGEAVHLRFLVGSAIGAPAIDVLRESNAGAWGMPLARALIAQLHAPGVSLVALPRGAMSLPAAVAAGRSAQRDLSAQLFTSNAIRSLRATVGEPTAVISAHEAPDAPGGGELRVSLSSPLSPRDASGFRCPLYAGERVDDVVTMLLELLCDCRLADVRLLSGIHPDRDRTTGAPLLFKPETIPPDARLTLH